MNYQVVDFRKPSRISDDIGRMLSQWQNSAREALELRWGRCLPAGVKVDVAAPAPLTGADLRVLDQSAVAYQVNIKESGAATLLMIGRPLALGLVGELLGESFEELPEDRSLTNIEMTCLDFLVEEFRTALQTSQKFVPPKTLQLIGRVNLKELFGQFPKNAANTEVGLKIDLSHGNELVRWVLPQDVTLDLAESFASTRTTSGENRKALEALLLKAPADLTIRLGAAQVPLSKLTHLKPGDIVVLNQKIEEPLVAEIGGQPMFNGWGGRIGRQQAFQLDEVTEGAVEQ